MNFIDIDLIQQRRIVALRVCGVGLVAFCLAIGPLGAENSYFEDAVEAFGLACIAAGVVGRA